ncbi:MAG TPA: DUF262 domain-containing HNH endonuclease family protein [Sphingomonas sp.]
MAATLSAHEKHVAQLFGNEYEFHIPAYQRPYAWKPEQADELVDDLLSFMQAQPGPINAIAPYFLGSIVLIKEDGKPRADVVDGQQRLTTLTILLSTLRALLPPERAVEITPYVMQPENVITGLKKQPRLQVRERDQAFFEEHVQKDGGFAKLLEAAGVLPDAQGRMRDNARLIHERLSALTQDDRERLAGFVLTRCFLVAVSTPDLESAYRIFSVMNSRGLGLSAGDILKAELVGKIPPSERDAYTKMWEDVEERLGRDAFVDLLGHIRMIARKQKPKATLLKEFVEHVASGRDPRDVIKATVVPLAEWHRQITEEAYNSAANAAAVNERLRWLNRLEFSDWLPPALAFLQRRGGDAAETALFFGKLERLAYAMMIDRWGVWDRIERFSRVTKAIEQGRLVIANKSLALSPDECKRTRKVLNGPIYEELSARARSTLLLRLDALLSGGGATYDHAIVTVEHVLPQNPAAGSKWLSWFNDEEVRRDRTHRLGNLALLTRKKNSAASNYEFNKKKEAYFLKDGVSPFPLTTQVIEHVRWTPEVVDARQKKLLRAFVKHWELDEAA